jgi:uncharacterized protein
MPPAASDLEAVTTGDPIPDAAPAVSGSPPNDDHDGPADGEDDEDEIDHGPITAAALQIGRSTVHGTGVFSVCDVEPGEIIERCPVLVLSRDDAFTLADTALGDYVYEWEDGCAVALGFGSLYNHSRTSNARYEMDYDLVEIDVVAVRSIRAGDEILINYNGDPAVTTPVWFETE